MAHEIAYIDNAYAFTRREGTEAPWHKLGGETPADATLEVWAQNAKMNFEVKSAPVMYDAVTDANTGISFQRTLSTRKVLYRSDNCKALGIVSNRYQVVQPSEVLNFFKDITQQSGWQMETAGVLKDGAKYWALASNEQVGKLGRDDLTKPYLLLATACDGSLATTAQFTTVRVVCNNTLQMSVDSKDRKGAVKVPHSTTFNAQAVHVKLGLGSTFDQFMAEADALASTIVPDRFAKELIVRIMGDAENEKKNARNIETVFSLFKGQAKGASFSSSKQTAWGLLNAVTEFQDHHIRSNSVATRLNTAWFGSGARVKNEFRNELLKIAA